MMMMMMMIMGGSVHTIKENKSSVFASKESSLQINAD